MDSSFFNIVMLAISLYVLYAGIAGKGKLYQADNIKEECKEQFHSILRKMFLALGIVMLLMSVCNFATTIGFKAQETTYTFTGDYTAPDGTEYKAGDPISLEKANEYLTAESESGTQQATGSSCAGVSSDPDSIQNKVIGKRNYAPRFPAMEKVDFETFDKAFRIAGGVLMGISVLMLVVLFVLINKMTDKEKKKEQREKAQQNVSAMPASAFNFDEDEPNDGDRQ